MVFCGFLPLGMLGCCEKEPSSFLQWGTKKSGQATRRYGKVTAGLFHARFFSACEWQHLSPWDQCRYPGRLFVVFLRKLWFLSFSDIHNVTNIRSFLYFVIVSGHITFEALGMCEVYKISEIASILVEAVISLGRNKASTNWVRTTFRFFFSFWSRSRSISSCHVYFLFWSHENRLELSNRPL